ncbi:MAG: tetratricopeptide repeat protein [Planctomycetes bacterium]|nr:tetratricopeptide repeat protein [Planctomycetota bacterium]
MDCEAYQADLPDLLYGELEADARPVVEAHRRGCAACDALTRELEAVKGALPPLRPPPLLAARLKLAARDELLDRGAPSFAPAAPEPATLRVVSAVVLAACVGLVGFALGTAWRPAATAPEPGVLRPPGAPAELPPAPDWAEPEPTRPPPRAAPRSPDAWQRVLFDSAANLRRQGETRQALEFFRRARAVAPEGPLAAAAMVGEAEALLRMGEAAEAARLLEEARRGILGGRLAGGPGLLQRIAELTAETERR